MCGCVETRYIRGWGCKLGYVWADVMEVGELRVREGRGAGLAISEVCWRWVCRVWCGWLETSYIRVWVDSVVKE